MYDQSFFRCPHFLAIYTFAAFLSGCSATAASDPLQAERQARLVGAPPLDLASSCESEATHRVTPKTPLQLARAGKGGWATLSFDLDGSGRATNAAIVQESVDSGIGQAALAALRLTKFKEGVIRQGCRQQIVISVL